jgi:hypothetical protein
MVSPVRFKALWTNEREYYAIGRDGVSGRPVLEVMMTGIIWYSRYFLLSDDEFAAWQLDHEALSELAARCAGAAGIRFNRERFLYSQMTSENAE